MAKNLTIALPDKIAQKLEEFPEVNWSQVARTCITNYIIQRQNPDIGDLLEALKVQKGEDFVAGRRFAENLISKIGYSRFDVLMREFEAKDDAEKEKTYYGQASPFDKIENSETILVNIIQGSIDFSMLQEASEAFLKGLLERLREIRRALG